MPLNVAAVLIVSEKRRETVQEIGLPSVLKWDFSEVVVVGDFWPGKGYRYLNVPKITGTTIDALVKRDVGTLATQSPWLFYLCDDHALLKAENPPNDPMVIGVPRRQSAGRSCNMGLDTQDPYAPYCGGHAGLFSRILVQQRPWTTFPHHPNWDLLASREQQAMGAQFHEIGWEIEDLEPEAKPWR